MFPCCFGGILGSNVRAFIVRIGFWDNIIIVIIRNPQNSIGNYLSPVLWLFKLKPMFGVGFGPTPRSGLKSSVNLILGSL